LLHTASGDMRMSFRLPGWSFAALAALATPLRSDDRFFKERVEPILSRCVRCHAGDAPSGGLDLTTRAGAIRGGESGPALIPTNPENSLIFSKVAAKKMPPKKPLTSGEIKTVQDWIAAGALWEGKIAVKGESQRAG